MVISLSCHLRPAILHFKTKSAVPSNSNAIRVSSSFVLSWHLTNKAVDRGGATESYTLHPLFIYMLLALRP